MSGNNNVKVLSSEKDLACEAELAMVKYCRDKSSLLYQTQEYWMPDKGYVYQRVTDNLKSLMDNKLLDLHDFLMYLQMEINGKKTDASTEAKEFCLSQLEEFLDNKPCKKPIAA